MPRRFWRSKNRTKETVPQNKIRTSTPKPYVVLEQQFEKLSHGWLFVFYPDGCAHLYVRLYTGYCPAVLDAAGGVYFTFGMNECTLFKTCSNWCKNFPARIVFLQSHLIACWWTTCFVTIIRNGYVMSSVKRDYHARISRMRSCTLQRKQLHHIYF